MAAIQGSIDTDLRASGFKREHQDALDRCGRGGARRLAGAGLSRARDALLGLQCDELDCSCRQVRR